MKFLTALLMFFPLLTFAQRGSPRETLEQRLLRAAREARDAVNDNLSVMTNQELIRAAKLLNQVTLTATGRGNEPVPEPTIVCEQESPEVYQPVFVQVKDFAYSSNGLDMNADNATRYATTWIRTYPCELAGKFITDFKRIKTFAYSSSGLDMNAQNAVAYGLAMVGRLCDQVQFEAIFSKHFNFAYSSSGLNMSAANARKYAQPKMEAEGFVCVNF